MSTKKQRRDLLAKAVQPDPDGKISEEFLEMAWAVVQGAILRAGHPGAIRVHIDGDASATRVFAVGTGRGRNARVGSGPSLRAAVDALAHQLALPVNALPRTKGKRR